MLSSSTHPIHIVVWGNFTFNPFSTRPHQNVLHSDTIILDLIRFSKNSELCTKRKRNIFCKKMSPHLSQLNIAMAHRNYFRWNNHKSVNPQIGNIYKDWSLEVHYSRCKLATFKIGKDCQMFIFYFVYTKHQVVLICNENKEISVANLMIQ